ncbi:MULTISPECIES: MadR family response regulator transcription factor [Rhodococcus]|jgi:two-component system response regulator DevR|uniref:Response regulator transcription factor n=1 Tax=Rhodococcus oxybenzonivorans TaxID=1990687 RepID=A0AAE4UWT2_9NOCA|nr:MULTISPECIES: response regulator transcription factor [Rhodococcus]MDV7245614.1 response regulator transcription factor [Rhodococcus oxybenzonivorans]MDV7264386.1 response regulator transcription factor [Rhodococcus oxybenzonivorans]MDV7277031.1 response regulator transcription factor [Rhodococcus oxybenzonivorans]MDV7336638.1 response regulator transcription factor [Rhodococcus oxybenzonivorans]MDV7346515.1 response regulator transcription factor [Rhodococcus oxybenzonivorans]
MTMRTPMQDEARSARATSVVRLVLVDDHAILRQGLRSVLEREPDLEVVGEASTSGEALDVVGQVKPDVVLMDLKLSAASDYEGLVLCAQLSSANKGLGLLVLTTFLDEQLVVRAVQAGARGYVVKDVDTTELVRAIRAVSRGESAFDSRSASAVIRSLNGQTTPREGLTERELEVLQLLATGLSNAKIGERLFISATTVKFHVSNIMRKLDVGRRAEAVYEAGKLGLI